MCFASTDFFDADAPLQGLRTSTSDANMATRSKRRNSYSQVQISSIASIRMKREITASLFPLLRCEWLMWGRQKSNMYCTNIDARVHVSVHLCASFSHVVPTRPFLFFFFTFPQQGARLAAAAMQQGDLTSDRTSALLPPARLHHSAARTQTALGVLFPNGSPANASNRRILL